MSYSVDEFIDRVSTVAGFSDEEKAAIINAKSSEDGKIDGDLSKAILGKVNSLATADFLKQDPKSWDEISKRAMGESMPGIEAGTKKVFTDAAGNFIDSKALDEIWADEKNGRINQKVYHAIKTITDNAAALIEKAKGGPEELHTKISRLEAANADLQKLLNTGSDEIELLKSDYEKRLSNKDSDFYLLRKIDRDFGVDLGKLEKAVLFQLNSSYTWKEVDGEGYQPFQKSNPEARATNSATNTILTRNEVLEETLVPFINKGGNPGKPPAAPPAPKGGGNGSLDALMREKYPSFTKGSPNYNRALAREQKRAAAATVK